MWDRYTKLQREEWTWGTGSDPLNSVPATFTKSMKWLTVINKHQRTKNTWSLHAQDTNTGASHPIASMFPITVPGISSQPYPLWPYRCSLRLCIVKSKGPGPTTSVWEKQGTEHLRSLFLGGRQRIQGTSCNMSEFPEQGKGGAWSRSPWGIQFWPTLGTVGKKAVICTRTILMSGASVYTAIYKIKEGL